MSDPMLGLKREVKWMWKSFGEANNSGNVSATVSGKLVLSWHGTPTQKDDVLKMLPVIHQKILPNVSAADFADAAIATIHEDGITNEGRNIQTVAMLWRLFTTPVDQRLPSFTYGDLVAIKNFHVAFELEEQPNDGFNITWKVSITP